MKGKRMSTIIALFGRRQVGKSHIADHLVNHHDFVRLHPFNPGKAGLRAVYEAAGATPEQARRMTDTDLKDVPVGFLPKRDLSTPNMMQDPKVFSETFARGYFEYLGIPKADVKRMVSGDLRHVPDARIPEGQTPELLIACVQDFAENGLWDAHMQIPFKSPKTQNKDQHPEAVRGHYTSRHVMEKIGHLLGVGMGAEWTLNAEISRSLRVDGEGSGKVIESIVYEAKDLPDLPGLFLVRVTSDQELPIESKESDAFIQTIHEDALFHNPMSGLDTLGPFFDESMRSQGIHYVHETEDAPGF